jgi:hypothetical protein
MCQSCSDELDVAFEFTEKVKQLESDFFGPARNMKAFLKSCQAQTTKSTASSKTVKCLKRRSQENGEERDQKVQILESKAIKAETMEVKVKEEPVEDEDGAANPASVETTGEASENESSNQEEVASEMMGSEQEEFGSKDAEDEVDNSQALQLSTSTLPQDIEPEKELLPTLSIKEEPMEAASPQEKPDEGSRDSAEDQQTTCNAEKASLPPAKAKPPSLPRFKPSSLPRYKPLSSYKRSHPVFMPNRPRKHFQKRAVSHRQQSSRDPFFLDQQFPYGW